MLCLLPLIEVSVLGKQLKGLAVNLHRFRSSLLALCLESQLFAITETVKVFDDLLGVRLEFFSQPSGHLLRADYHLLDRLGQLLNGHQLLASGGRVGIQVKGGPVGHSNRLHPTMGEHDFGIPAVTGVVGHFGGQVLPESQVFPLDSCPEKETLCAGHHVTQAFICNNPLLHGFSDSHINCGLCRQLLGRREQGQDFVFDEVELGMRFTPFAPSDDRAIFVDNGFAEELNLTLGELPLADQTSTRCNFVAEGLANLSHPKGHLTAILLQAILEIQEDTLGGLGAEIALQISSWANRCREHQIEGVRVRKIVASQGALDVVLLQDIT
mmetsp:Transcript_80794/g.142376  ORF Transcript_80794/g.142376 Transcript_80794/m.142376 type:complete len:326 (-) Transcript_80794:637-1614(-)